MSKRAGQLPRLLIGAGIFGVLIAVFFSVRPSKDARLRREFQSAERVSSKGHSSFVIPESKRDSNLERQIVNVDPKTAGWNSETVSEAITAQLYQLKKIVESKGLSLSSSDLAQIVTPSFEGILHGDKGVASVFADEVWQATQRANSDSESQKTGAFDSQIKSLLGLENLKNVRCSFKLTHIELSGDEAATNVLAEFVQVSPKSVQQSNSEWHCVWDLQANDTPLLRSVKFANQREVELSAQGRPLMEDVTAAVLGNTESFDDQVLRGVGHWSERLSKIDDMDIYGHHGLAIGDVNDDGLDDLYVCDSGGLPNRLYIHQPDGTLKDESESSKANWLEATKCALLIDLDNDGDQDLVAATIAGLIFASNNGSGVFKIRAAETGFPEAHSMCAADYDNDGDLDLYVTNYGPGGSVDRERGFEAAAPVPYNDANNGGSNVLFRNNGRFKFEYVTDTCGLNVNNQRFSFAASWEDFDADGDMDLYVANDFGRNNLYQNENGMFQDIAARVGVEDMAGGMSVSWGDFTQDGLMDIYVGNMFSAAGKRVTYQRQFLDGRSASSSAGVRRMARGNTLFMAQPDGTFADVSESADVTMGRWAWSSKFVDLNNDGREDLVVANGYFSNDKSDDL